ncbi:MAG: S-layer homology domain-containing protein [Bacillota bacterium]
MLLFILLGLPFPCAADVPSLWVTKDIFSPTGEKIVAGPRVLATVGGQVYMALAAQSRVYLLSTTPQLVEEGSTRILYTCPASFPVGACLDMAPTPAGCHLVWDDNGVIRHLFVPWDGDPARALLTEVGAGILPVCFPAHDGVVLHYLKKKDGLYRVLARRSWSLQSGWSGEETVGITGDQYAGLCAGPGEKGPVAAVANYRQGADQLHILGTDPGLPAVIDSVYGTIIALAFVSGPEGPYLLWHDGDISNSGKGVTRLWHAGKSTPLREAFVSVKRLAAVAGDGKILAAYQDPEAGVIRYFEVEGSRPSASVTLAATGEPQVTGLDLLSGRGGIAVYWVPSGGSVLKLTYPVTTASVAAYTCSGRELPGAARYYYYPSAPQNNRLRLRVTPERPLPDGVYADLGALAEGARIDGVTEDGGRSFLVDGPFPDAAAGLMGAYPVVIRHAPTGTELARFEAILNVKPDPADFNGETTDWAAIPDFTAADIVLQREGVARVAFSAVDLTRAGVNEIVYFGDQVDLSRPGTVVLAAENLPAFRNLPVEVTLYGLPYTSLPDLLLDGKPAGDAVSNLVYTPPGGGAGGILSFRAAHSSTFAAVPRVEILSPRDGATVREPCCTVRGTVNDPGAAVRVAAGGAEYAVTATGGAWDLIVPLQEGENLLTVTALGSIAADLTALPCTLRVVCLGQDTTDGGNGNGGDPPGDENPGERRASGDAGGNHGGNEIAAAAPLFQDIAGHWARAAIEELAVRGLVRGVAPGRFDPDRQINRAEVLALVLRLLGVEEVRPASPAFADVSPGSWFYAPVETGYRAGLVGGTGDGRFAPGRPVTRQEMALLLARALEKTGMDTSLAAEEQERLLGAFTDAAAIAPWARPAVAVAVKHGLVQGRPGGIFDPLAGATRAETAVLILRLGRTSGLIP